MRQLADILEEKRKELGSFAKIGKRVGEAFDGKEISGQVIGKYASGKTSPSIDFVIGWKIAFGENLIELMIEKPLSIAAEPDLEPMKHPFTEVNKETLKKMRNEIVHGLRDDFSAEEKLVIMIQVLMDEIDELRREMKKLRDDQRLVKK